MELENRKPLLDIGQFVQPYVKYPIKTDAKDDIKRINKSALCCVYTAHNVVEHEHDADYGSGISLAAHQMSCNINTYKCELYSYFTDVEVIPIKIHQFRLIVVNGDYNFFNFLLIEVGVS